MRERLVFNSVINAIMAVCMSVTASLLNGGITAATWWQSGVGFAVGMAVGSVIPFDRVSRRLFRLDGIKTSRLRFVLLAPVVPAVVNTVVISAVMTAINVPPWALGFEIYSAAYISTLWIMLCVGYVAGLAASPLAAAAVRMAVTDKGGKSDENNDNRS